MNKNLPLVSVVVATYKRFNLLKQTIEAFQLNCTYPNIEYILCDDGSDEEIQKKMHTLPFDKFLMGKENRGMGHNKNKGILVASGEYIIQVDDDYCVNPTNCQKNFVEVALEVFEERPDVHLLRYLTSKGMHNPALQSLYLYITNSGIKVEILDNKLAFPSGEYPRQLTYAYNDWPHIKRRSFHEKLGLYKENVHMTTVEGEFCRRYERQTEMNMGCLVDYDVFLDVGQGDHLRRFQDPRPYWDEAPIKFPDKKLNER